MLWLITESKERRGELIAVGEARPDPGRPCTSLVLLQVTTGYATMTDNAKASLA